MAKLFMDFGYVQREELRFPAKKLKAYWFSPPNLLRPDSGAGVDGPLPRIFISELLVDQMSDEAQVPIKIWLSVYLIALGFGYDDVA